VAVVAATVADGRPVGMVVGTFTSVSLTPPLVAFMAGRSSRTFVGMRSSSSFAVSILAAGQDDVRRAFARCDQQRRWHGVAWRRSPSGAPIIEGVPAWVDCTWGSITPAGDHHVVLGAVTALGRGPSSPPLVFHEGRYVTVDAVTSLDAVASQHPLRVDGGCYPTGGLRALPESRDIA
jgi:flavin reductase (DIM6/NTAB) family NADH-FMN oxidoreductase RutF